MRSSFKRLSVIRERRMSVCPHCHQNAINPFKGLWSDAACPVRCPHCKGLAYLHHREMSGLRAVWNIGFVALIPAVLLTHSLLVPLALWTLWWLAACGLVMWKSPLCAISPPEAVERRRYANIALGLVVVAVVVVWFVAHG